MVREEERIEHSRQEVVDGRKLERLLTAVNVSIEGGRSLRGSSSVI